jgi:hypothetical protein
MNGDELEPGETIDAYYGDWRINASRVRIWAKFQTTEWLAFQNADLWLVPEQMDDGQHAYEGADLQVFNYTVR